MSISLVIPTCALGNAALTPLSSGKQAHAFRAYLLRCFTLPQALANPLIAEVIIVGEFETGANYRYLEVPSVTHDNVRDALHKRDVGCRAATGDWIMMLADDHVLDSSAISRTQKYTQIGDVVSLNRRTRMRHADGETLNSGMRDGYINGHAALYRRDVLEHCPWSAVERRFTFDVLHTEQVKHAGFHVVYAPDAYAEDVEYGAMPWR